MEILVINWLLRFFLFRIVMLNIFECRVFLEFYFKIEGLVYFMIVYSVSMSFFFSGLLIWSIGFFSFYVVSCRNSVGRSEGFVFGEGYYYWVILRIRINSVIKVEYEEK